MKITIECSDGLSRVLEIGIPELTESEIVEAIKEYLYRRVREAHGGDPVIVDEDICSDHSHFLVFPFALDEFGRVALPNHIPTPEELQEAEQDRKGLARFFDHLFHDYPTGDTP